MKRFPWREAVLVAFVLLHCRPAYGKIPEWHLTDGIASSEYIVVGTVTKMTDKTTVTVEQVLKGRFTKGGTVVINHAAYAKKHGEFSDALSLPFKEGKRFVLFLDNQFEVVHFYHGAVEVTDGRETDVLPLYNTVSQEDLPLYIEAIKRLLSISPTLLHLAIPFDHSTSEERKKLFDEFLNDQNVFLRRAAFEFSDWWDDYWTRRAEDFPGKAQLRTRLLQALEDADARVRFLAGEAVWKSETSRLVPGPINALGDTRGCLVDFL